MKIAQIYEWHQAKDEFFKKRIAESIAFIGKNSPEGQSSTEAVYATMDLMQKSGGYVPGFYNIHYAQDLGFGMLGVHYTTKKSERVMIIDLEVENPMVRVYK